MIEAEGRRTVEHRVYAVLSGDDRFRSTNGGSGRQQNIPFLVTAVRWPGRYHYEETLRPDSQVSLSGPMFKQDGEIGTRQGQRNVTLDELPEQVRAALVRAYDQVYAP